MGIDVPAWTVKIFEDHVRRHYFPNGEPLADMDLLDPVWAEKHRQDNHVPTREEDWKNSDRLLPSDLSPLGIRSQNERWFKLQAYCSIRDG